MRVAFRVDASTKIGTGHVMRCLTLADRLAAGGAECVFVMRAHPGHLGTEVAARGYRICMLAPPDGVARDDYAQWLGADWAADATDTAAALEADGLYDWLVIDHYALDARWQTRMRARASRLMVIDDLADRPHDCDLLVDQNLQTPGRYADLVSADATLLTGPRYAILRPEFAALRAATPRDAAAPVRRLLVFLGGVDAPGYTPRVLAAVEAARGGDLAVDVVIGPQNPRKAEIEAFCAARDWLTLYATGADMASLMAAADLAVGAGGTTTWERCALALPTVIIAIAENQKPGAEAVAATGAGLYVGDGATLDNADLVAALRTLIANPWLRGSVAAAASDLVDGRGTDRVAAHLAARIIRLRPATPDDCAPMLLWRNHEDTRRHFRDPRPVAPETHRDWLQRSIASTDRDLLIGEVDGQAVGVLRYDRSGDVAAVSIYVVPGSAARGDGPRLLRAGTAWLAAERPDVRFIEAEVLGANAASHQTFRAAGFDDYSMIYRRQVPGARGRN